MILEKLKRFDEELEDIILYISKDSPKRALDFYDELMLKIENILTNPYIHKKRKNDNEKIRELIFKGYTIPFYIDDTNDKIIILGIFNQNLWE